VLVLVLVCVCVCVCVFVCDGYVPMSMLVYARVSRHCLTVYVPIKVKPEAGLVDLSKEEAEEAAASKK